MAASIQHREIEPTFTQTPPIPRDHQQIGSHAADFVSPDLRFKREELAEVAAKGSVDQALAIANGDDLDEASIVLLAHRPEATVVHALAANNRVRINHTVLRALIERGRNDPKLAQFLLRREDLHLCHLRLFLNADAEQRRHLIAITCRSRLGRVCRGELCRGFDAGKLARLELAALNRDLDAFRNMLSHALCCDLSTASRIAEDKSGEVMALVMVALGLPVENVARLLQSGFPEICKTKAAFRTLINIVGRVPRPAAIHILLAIVNDRAPVAA
jgi:uncharacterized protein (DUF2336 family)